MTTNQLMAILLYKRNKIGIFIFPNEFIQLADDKSIWKLQHNRYPQNKFNLKERGNKTKYYHTILRLILE